MSVDRRTGNLIAVGAAIAANCHGCLRTSAARAVAAGAEPQDLADALEIGRKVRAAAAHDMDGFAATLDIPVPARPTVRNATCGCES